MECKFWIKAASPQQHSQTVVVLLQPLLRLRVSDNTYDEYANIILDAIQAQKFFQDGTLNGNAFQVNSAATQVGSVDLACISSKCFVVYSKLQVCLRKRPNE